ncbi:unnamed protein product [Arabidopsis arenosa]|uniref:Uncharacterized protein n=1 Tax=Arabidopsis arenosa TaxID=38785 RepID=A0A8S2AK25_ARAAE|nr:unnamed protein product [Arabidopsis arenosa]
MVSSDDWTKCAMRDGEVVAELLVKLKQAKVIKNPIVAALRWGIQQPRSRCPRKETESRCSPSTPLSWSGGCGGSSSSPSGYVDGYEATSRQISAVGSRSKVLVTSDLDFDVKRLQRKKNIASLRSPFSERGVENNNLKRMKMNHSQNLAENENRKADGNFLLPDLNIMPCDENSDHYSSLGVETTLYGIRIIS